jgi:hypothetical protein
MNTTKQFAVGAAAAALLFLASGFTSLGQVTVLKIEDVMTAAQMKETGIDRLTPSERQALNIWLDQYTQTVLRVGQEHTGRGSRGDCTPAVESTIQGDFEGWDGETVFKLDNGQIWQQATYDYMYSYEYRPDVTIYQTSAGCTMKVEGEDETVEVKRIK